MMSRDLLSSEFGRRVAIESLEPRTLLSAGALDSTFGTAGQVTLAGSTPLAFNREPLAVQGDGKIVIAVGGSQTQIERLNADGSPDSTFGSHGVVASPLAGVNALAIESDGKIVLGGYQSISSGTAHFALARLNADGSADTSFGSSGTIVSSIDGYVGAQSLAVGADGTIVAAGIELPPSSGQGTHAFHVARYNPDGSLDTSFNGTGEVTEPLSHSNDFNDAPATPALAVQTDGKILIGAASEADLAIWRFDTNGSLDSSFDGGGVVTTPVSYTGETNQTLGTDAAVTNLIVQGDGRILAGGTIVSPASDDISMLVARYNPDGTVSNAPAIVSAAQFGYETELPAGMALQADGKVVLGWYLPNPGGPNQPSSFYVERLNADFSNDSTFTLPSSSTIPVDTLAMAADGKLIVAGAQSQSGNVIVSRLLNDTPANTGGGSGSSGTGGGTNTGGSGTGNGTGTGTGTGTGSGTSTGTGGSVGANPGPVTLPAGQISVSFLKTIPATASAGATATAVLRLVNSAVTRFLGPVSITISISPGKTFSTTNLVLAHFSLHRVNLKSGAVRVLRLRVKYPATLAAGQYTLAATASQTGAGTAPAVGSDPSTLSVTPAVHRAHHRSQRSTPEIVR